MTSSEEAQALLAGAKKRLDYARSNHESEMYGPATSLAYYAVFYGAQAVIAHHRQSARPHRGVQNLFWQLAVEGSDFPPETARIISTLETHRLKVDYTALIEVTKEDAAEAIHQAETFVKEVTAWFQRHRPT